MTLQGEFSYTPVTIDQIVERISAPRFQKYLEFSQHDAQNAIKLYRWNAALSQSLLWPLQCMEVCIRNSIALALVDKYGPGWHLDATFLSVLDNKDASRLDDAIQRQSRQRSTPRPGVDPVVADLSFGFWSALASKKYEIPIGWQRRIRVSFPHIPQGVDIRSVAGPMQRIRDLRNRVAHHEPIFHLKLRSKYNEVMCLTNWSSPDVEWMVRQSCRFQEILANKPF